ncbi:MAG: PPC domain-containing protein, partial [Planctomycetes bacterium]|nr:PPC domain-containing protein [Planctomycetota bacterium]
NPRTFTVGDLPEVAEKEPNNDVGEAQRIELNTTVNGVISAPTDVDFVVFPGKKGQRVIVSCLTSSIDSKARPMIEMYDVSQKRIAFNRNYNGNDALADGILPEDGDYFVRLSEFTYTQGSPLHFYRLTISTAPWIDAVFPPMVEPGKPAQVTLYGRNLPGGTPEPGALVEGRPVEKLVVTVNPPTDAGAASRLTMKSRVDPRVGLTDGFEYRLKGPSGMSNPMLIAYATGKVVLEKENNDKIESAESIPVPCEVAGRIDKRQDRDWYTFNLKKGDIYTLELWSDRLGVPTDLYFAYKKDKANEAEEDDAIDILQTAQFYNRTSDPKSVRLAPTEDGQYFVGVGSRESNFAFGPRVTYRLRVTPEKPDFRVIIMPSSTYQPDTTVLRAGGLQYLDVFVQRLDGFTGPITLTAEGLPPGVTCPPSVVSTGMKQGTLVLSADASAVPFSGTFTVKGTATIAGQPAIREARPATITWSLGPQQNQNIPAITRLDQGLFLAVREAAQFKITIEPENSFIKMGEKQPLPLMLKQGDKLTVPFKITRSPETKTPITLQQISMGVNPQQAPISVGNGAALPVIAADKNDGTFIVDVKPTTPPGTYTIVMKASTPIQFAKEAKKNVALTIVTATTPLVIKVLPTVVAKVTATPKGNLKPGMPGEVTVKVERLNEYTGDFKVKLTLPPTAKGLSADEVTIPAGKDEIVVPVKVAADATAGTIQNVVATATGTVEGKIPIVQDTKFNLTVDKVAPVKDKK